MAEKQAQILVRMPIEQHDALRRVSFDDRRSMNEIANEAIQEWLARRAESCESK